MKEKATSTYAATPAPLAGRPHNNTPRAAAVAAIAAAPITSRPTCVKRDPVHRHRVSKRRAGVSTSRVDTISWRKPTMYRS